MPGKPPPGGGNPGCWLFHRWNFVGGNFNQYFECARCGKRKVVKGQGGYQPLRRTWLDGGAWDTPPRNPPQGGPW